MTNPEQLRPDQLAEQILGSDYETTSGRVESLRLGNLIDRSQRVWRQLKINRFEENEYGYATFEVHDWVGDYMTDSGDHVDALEVQFHDPLGNVTRLGRVARLDSYSPKATAYVYTGGDRKEPLLPNDARWDAVVGVTERAIDTCYQRDQRAHDDW